MIHINNLELQENIDKLIEPILCSNYQRNIHTNIESYQMCNYQILEAYNAVGDYLQLNEPLHNNQELQYDKSAILSLDKQLCLKVLKNICELDLKSCYPSLLLQSKLIPVTLFNLIQSMIRLRTKYDKKHPKNALFKQIINSLVGKLGSDKPYLYQFKNKPLHAEVMQMSRDTIQKISTQCKGQQLAIYTDAVYCIDIQNESEVVQMVSDLGLQLEVEHFTHFYHSPTMNMYIAMKEDSQLKIRGFRGFNKQTCKFDKYHKTELLEQAIKAFFYSDGNHQHLQQYVQDMRLFYKQLQESDQQQDRDQLIRMTIQEKDFIIDQDRLPVKQDCINVQDIDIETIIQNHVQRDINRLLGITLLKQGPSVYIDNHLIIAKHESKQGKLVVSHELVDIRTITDAKLKRNNTSSLHEVIRQDSVKLFCDLDIIITDKYTNDQFKADFLQLIQSVMEYFGNIDYATCSYKKDNTISMHIVWQIVVDLDIQLVFFTHLNKLLKCDQFVDLNVYYINKSIRLPICQKVTEKGIMQDQQLQIVKGKLEDFFITNTKGIPFYCSDMFEGQMISHVKLNNTNGISQLIVHQIHTYLQSIGIKAGGFISKQQGLINFVVNDPPVKCIICQRHHEQTINRQRGMYVYYYKTTAVLTCSRVNNRQYDTSIVKKHTIQLQEQTAKTQIAITDFVYYDDPIGKRYISDYNLPVVFEGCYIIQSAMGTGKSQFISKCIEANKTVLYVSCRKTFSSKVQKEFGLQSYRCIEGLISPLINKKVVVQVESLERLDLSINYDLIILDEFVSIMDHSSQDHRLIHLIQKQFNSVGSSMIICDALLNEAWISVLQTMLKKGEVGSNITIIKNAYKPDKGKKLLINQFTDTSISLKYIAQDIIDKHMELSQNGSIKSIIGVFCSSCTSMDYIEKAINDLNPGLKVRSYHGKNDRIESDSRIHQQVKDEDLQDVNESWSNYDIILYTSTITVGISFDTDIPIHQFMVLQSGPSIPSMTAIYQAIARFRKSQAYTIYLKGSLKRSNNGLVTGRQMFVHNYIYLNGFSSFYLDTAVESFISTQNYLGWNWLQFALQQNGYELVIQELQIQQQEHLEDYVQERNQNQNQPVVENQELFYLNYIKEYLQPSTHDYALYNMPAEIVNSGLDNIMNSILSSLIRINDTLGNGNYITLEDIISRYKRCTEIQTIVKKCLQNDKEYLVPDVKTVYSKRQLYSWFIDNSRIEILRQQKGRLTSEQCFGFPIQAFSGLQTTITKIQQHLKTDKPLRQLQLTAEYSLQVCRDVKVASQIFNDALYILGYYKETKQIRIDGKNTKQQVLQSVQCNV